MDSATDVVKTSSFNAEGFFKTVFNFDDDSKAEMMNMLQYMCLAVLPCVIILKTVGEIIPEEDDTKGSFEILAEIVGQLALLVILMYFTNKAIKYAPTYSGTAYVASSAGHINFLLPFMILLLTMQTKIGQKVNILYDRLLDQWHGRNEDAFPNHKVNNNVKVSQPLAGQHHVSRSDTMDNGPGLLPNNPGVTTQVPNLTSMPTQENPDFNLMYQSEVTPMPNAQTPGDQEGFGGNDTTEPMAANSFGGGFSGW
ncbi:MAG: hypothetical protein CMI79_06635 [Candidatus Pelagibacter sp.]|nr:hypothetical protein [Candidatus Pelagibacter sp.]|tara:strand:- start:1624 stop:2385 length:762 start_codon:yes stop_codon:yes gene_type:complete